MKQEVNSTPVFVVGTLFSGSTLLGHELTARLDNAQYIGEMTNFLRHSDMYAPKAADMPCSICNSQGRECPFLNTKLQHRLSYNNIPDVLKTMSHVFDKSVIIDGSKYVAWLQKALVQGFSGQQPRVIICTRNPFAFALSHRNRNGGELWQGANIWRDTYADALRTINHHGLAHVVVRYEDFILHRDKTVENLAPFLLSSLLPKADFSRCHASGGNWSAAVPFVGTKQMEKAVKKQGKRAADFVAHSRDYWAESPKIDTRWYQLSTSELTQITQTPGLADIATLLGYNLPRLILESREAAT